MYTHYFSESGAVIDYKDWQLPLGRRFRALKLWFTLRNFGRNGLIAHIRNGVTLARKFESLVVKSDIFELVTPGHFALCVFRLKGTNEINEALLEDLNTRGKNKML